MALCASEKLGGYLNRLEVYYVLQKDKSDALTMMESSSDDLEVTRAGQQKYAEVVS